uniref:LysM domain-containing protein n=1 Tax=Tetradesmus obliquus TaxID=3088 RepID=A0A383VQJ9_TETOB|eukprot:jgi/Sobl393_1/14787/SZX66676.1
MKSTSACALLAAAVLLLAGTARADCPDRDVRCRIPNAEWLVQESSSGCEGGGTVDVGFAGNVPSGSVGISGKCYKAYKETDGTYMIPMGSFSTGTCYQYRFPDMSVSESCRPCSSLVEQCSARVPGCRKCDRACTYSHTVVSGDNCWAIANDHGMTVETMQQMNPGLNCDPLQINEKICLAMGDGACTDVCEGRFV